MSLPNFINLNVPLCQRRAHEMVGQLVSYYAKATAARNGSKSVNFEYHTFVSGHLLNEKGTHADAQVSVTFKTVEPELGMALANDPNFITDIKQHVRLWLFVSNVTVTPDDEAKALDVMFNVSGDPGLMPMPTTGSISSTPYPPGPSVKSEEGAGKHEGAQIFDPQKEIGKLNEALNDIQAKLRGLTDKVNAIDRKVT